LDALIFPKVMPSVVRNGFHIFLYCKELMMPPSQREAAPFVAAASGLAR